MGDLDLITNATSFEALVNNINVATNSLFGNILLVVFFIIIFSQINLRVGSFVKSMLISLFFTTLVSLFLANLNLTNIYVTYILSILTISALLYSYMRR